MSNLVTIPTLTELSPLAQQRYQQQMDLYDRVTNMKKVLLLSVPAFDALMEWYPMFDEVKKIVGEQAALFFAHAISNQNECLICNTFFVKILRDRHINIENFQLDETQSLLVRYGQALVSNPHDIDEQIYQALQAHFTQEQIVILTAFASIMIATNLINTALKVPLDEYLYEYTDKHKIGV